MSLVLFCRGGQSYCPLTDLVGLRTPGEDGDGASSLCVFAEGTRVPLVDSGVSTCSLCMVLSRAPFKDGKGSWAAGVSVESFDSAWADMSGMWLTWGIVIAFISLWTVRDDLSPFFNGRGLWEPSWFKGEIRKSPSSAGSGLKLTLLDSDCIGQFWGRRGTSLGFFVKGHSSLPCFPSCQTCWTLLARGGRTWYIWDKWEITNITCGRGRFGDLFVWWGLL